MVSVPRGPIAFRVCASGLTGGREVETPISGLSLLVEPTQFAPLRDLLAPGGFADGEFLYGSICFDATLLGNSSVASTKTVALTRQFTAFYRTSRMG